MHKRLLVDFPPNIVGISYISYNYRMPTDSSAEALRSPKVLKSYLARIQDATKASSLAAFSAFPPQTGFSGQDRGEHIVLLLRQHPGVLIPRVFVIIFMFILPVLVLPFLSVFEMEIAARDVVFGFGLMLLWVMLAITYAVITLFKWFFNVNIVTTERIIDIDFDHLFDHRVSEAQLEKIEDVSHSAVGMWAVIFDYGSVFIQTAAQQREFEFRNIPRPRDVQDTINDLLELKQARNG